METFKSVVCIFVLIYFAVAFSAAFHLHAHEPIGRQDEGEEDTPAAATTELPTNNHLLGTLAGILSAILRSGANATSPLNFNLTMTLRRALQHLVRFQLLPSLPPPLFPSAIKKLDVKQNKVFAPIPANSSKPELEKSSRQKRSNQNPTNPSLYAVSNEFVEKTTPEVEAPEDDVTDRLSSLVQEGNPEKFVVPTSFPIYSVVSTTEVTGEPLIEDNEYVQQLDIENERVTAKPAKTVTPPIRSVEQASTEVSPSIDLDFSNIKLQNVNVPGFAFDVGLYLNPALKLVKDATRNISIKDVVNGTAEGVKGIMTQLPNFAEAIAGLVDYFDG